MRLLIKRERTIKVNTKTSFKWVFKNITMRATQWDGLDVRIETKRLRWRERERKRERDFAV